MDIVAKVEEAREDLRLKRLKAKLEEADSQTARLRDENRILHEELDRLVPARSHPLRRLVLVTVGTGCAYLMGARAGRERYEQALEWAKRAKDRVTGANITADNAMRAVTDAGAAVVGGAGEVREAGKDAVSRSRKAVETTTDRIGEAARQAMGEDDEVGGL